MRYCVVLLLIGCFCACTSEKQLRHIDFYEVEISPIFTDTLLSVRALDFDETYVYYGSYKDYGKIALNKGLKINLTDLKIDHNKQHYRFKHKTNDSTFLAFRAIAVVNGDLFALSIANPAKLYKLSRKAKQSKLVYQENNERVFYDAMDFWNDQEGIAIGDPTDDCMSIIITRDYGNTWQKIPCDRLPKVKDGEAAFAASDTNIAMVGDHTWVATGGKASRVLYSPDKGSTWEVFDTPIVQGKATTGIYSIDFYDVNNGFAIGGDYTMPDDTDANKIRTKDGGKTWEVVGNKQSPGYRSCIQYVPNSNAQQLVAVGFKGIDYSKDAGNTWLHLSDESFYTIRFLNDSTAYAGGKGRIAKLIFR